MLPDTDPRVGAFLVEMQGKRQLTSDEMIITSMKDGTSWPKCWQKHQDAKKALEEHLGMKVPSSSLVIQGLVSDFWLGINSS